MAVRKALARLLGLIELLIFIFALFLGVLLVIPRFAGYEMYNVISGSMEPEIPVGSLIYTKQIDPADLNTKDVVVFKNENGAVISHRVVKNKVVSGEIVTKGDANDEPDPTPVVFSQVIGKEVLHLPKIGQLLAAITTTNGKFGIICFILAAALLHLIKDKIYRK